MSAGLINPDTVQGNNIAIGSYAGYQNQAVDVNYPQYAGKSIAIGYYAAKIDQAGDQLPLEVMLLKIIKAVGLLQLEKRQVKQINKVMLVV